MLFGTKVFALGMIVTGALALASPSPSDQPGSPLPLSPQWAKWKPQRVGVAPSHLLFHPSRPDITPVELLAARRALRIRTLLPEIEKLNDDKSNNLRIVNLIEKEVFSVIKDNVPDPIKKLQYAFASVKSRLDSKEGILKKSGVTLPVDLKNFLINQHT